MLEMAVWANWLRKKILQMQLTINFHRELPRLKCTKMPKTEVAILLKGMRLFSSEAPLTAENAFRKSNRDILQVKFQLVKFNLKKVEIIAKLVQFKKMTVFHRQHSLSMYMATKILARIQMRIVKNA